MRFFGRAAGSLPRPRQGLTALPGPSSWNLGILLLRRGMGRKGERKGGGRKEIERGKRWRGGKKREEERKVSGFAPSGKKNF